MDTSDRILQRSEYTFVYAIPVDSVQKVVYGNRHSISPHVDWLQRPAYVIPFGFFDSLMKAPDVNPGHYLSVSADMGEMKMQMGRKQGFYVDLFTIGQLKILLVKDQHQLPVADAVVTVSGKLIRYSQRFRGYVLGQVNMDDEIQIRRGDDVISYTYRSYQDWNDHSVGFAGTGSGGRKYKGYLVTNKPYYLPGDTVRFKAYLKHPNKKKEIQEPLHVYYNGGNKHITVNMSMNPDTPGVYFSEFVLGDSLRTNVKYNLHLQGKKSGLTISQPFFVDDYLLDEIWLRVSAGVQQLYQNGDSIHLYAHAYNSNNLPVQDGILSLTVTPEYDIDKATKSIFIPDTLYQLEIPVNPQGETHIVVPTADFPDLPAGLNCIVVLLNGNGERKDTSFTISYTNAGNYVQVTQSASVIRADLVKHGASIPGKGVFVRYFITNPRGFGDIERQLRDTIVFPFEYKLTGWEDRIGFFILNDSGAVSGEIDYPIEESSLSATESFSNDTALIDLKNPFGLAFRFGVYVGNEYVGGGFTDKDTLIRVKSSGKQTVTVSGIYQWKGEQVKKKFIAYYLSRKLDIHIQKRDIVYPGQQDTVRIRITDQTGLPVQRLNTTVLAFNNQFPEDYTPQVPYDGYLMPAFSGGGVVSRMALPYYYGSPYNVKLSDAWLRKCAADTQFYYRNIRLLPDDICWIEYDTPEDSLAQLGLFFQFNGVYRQPEIVYIDDLPVYFNRASSTNPNSLFVSEGVHRIALRFDKALYTIDSFAVCAGKKLNVFVNADSLGLIVTKNRKRRKVTVSRHYTHLNKFVHKTFMPDTLETKERTLLSRHLLQYFEIGDHRSEALFYQYPNLVRHQRQLPGRLIGPFDFRDSISFFQADNTRMKFMPELNYIYSFEPGTKRLEKHVTYDLLKYRINGTSTEPAPWFILPPPQGTDSLSLQSDAGEAIRMFHSLLFKKIDQAEDPAKCYGRFSLSFADLNVKNIHLAIRSLSDSNYIVIRNNYRSESLKLPAGYYQVFVIGNNDSCITIDSLHIRPFGHTLLRLDQSFMGVPFDYDDMPEWLLPYVEIAHSSIKSSRHAKKWSGGISDGAVRAVVIDEFKEPIVGAVIRLEQGGIVKGGGITDLDGECIIEPIVAGRYDLVISYTGMKTLRIVDIILLGGRITEINKMLQSSTLLSSVEVASKYYPPSKKENREMVAERIYRLPTRNTDDFSGMNTGVYQQGNMSGIRIGGSRNDGELIIIDGIQTNASAESLSGSANVRGRKDERKNALAEPGTQEFIEAFMRNQMSLSGLRKNFRDWAIWEPDLWTDHRGEAMFSVTYPDNLTSWKVYVLAMNRHGYGGKVQTLTRSFKPLAAQLAAPVFLRYGDLVTVIGKTTNYTGNPFRLQSSFMQDHAERSSDTFTVTHAHVEDLKLAAPEVNHADTAGIELLYQVTAESGYTDGEERSLPVYPVGVVEIKGMFTHIFGDTTFTVTLPDAEGKYTGTTRIEVDGNQIGILLREIEQLKVYPYGCTEQLTSRLLAVQYEESVKKLLSGQRLNNTAAKKKIIAQIIRAQHDDGSFGWWSGDAYDYRVTNYVLQTLQKMKQDELPDAMVERGLSFLQSRLPIMSSDERLVTLRTLAQAGYPAPYAHYLTLADTMERSIYDRFVIAYIKKSQQLPYRRDLDSLIKLKIEHKNGIYWSSNIRYDWLKDDIPVTLLAYELVKGDSVYGHLEEDILRYLMFKKQFSAFNNTATSGMVLATVLPDLLRKRENTAGLAKQDMRGFVTISGSLEDSIVRFPATRTLRISENPVLHVVKKGFDPAYISVVHEFFNTEPQPYVGAFSIHTRFLEGRDSVTSLRYGRQCVMQARVANRMDAEYVMIEIPIPAGTTHDRSRPPARSYYETHRENFKDRTVIFCRNMPVGTHIFDVPLDARYKGRFVLSPARAGMMYYPDEYGNTEVKRVEIR